MIKAEKIGAILFRDLIWKFQGREKELFLTFDDGPEPNVTDWVLEILQKYDAKATFFCLGKKVEENPKLFSDIIAKGHSVGNHTYSHLKAWSTAGKNYISDVKRASKYIETNLFRPPYGKIRPHQVKELKKDFKIVMWDILAKDYDKRVSEQTCLRNVINYAESGSIIVLHDSLKAKEKLQYVLPRILEHYSNLGFRFSSIPFTK